MKKIQDLEYIQKCDLCGSKKTRPFLTVADRNYQTGNFTYVLCVNCSLIRLSPRPKLKILDKYYPTIYPPYRQLTSKTQMQKIVRAIFGVSPFMARFFIKDQLFFAKPKGKLLDVGTGNGLYMSILRDWGWDTHGVELSNAAVRRAHASGIKNLHQGTIFTAPLKKNFFDVIRFSHVLEHVPSPKKELKQTFKLLKTGGQVLILIPNIDSIFFRLFKSYWYPLEAPRHFHQFTPNTITRLLADVGFRNIHIHFNQSPYPVLWSLKYLLGKEKVEQKIGFLSYPLGLLLRIVNVFRKSDIIEVTAFK